MDADDFAALKSELISRFPPSAGDDLLGMDIDFFHFLGQVKGIPEVAVKRSSDPNGLIMATAKAKPGYTPEAVAAGLEAVWLQYLCYKFREAHVVAMGPGTVRRGDHPRCS